MVQTARSNVCLFQLTMDSNLLDLQELDTAEIANSAILDVAHLYTYLQRDSKNLTVLTQNIRSIYSNFDDFQITLSQIGVEVDVLILTECRLNANKPLPVLNNYTSFNTFRQLNQNDGVVAYIKNCHLPLTTEINLTHASALQIKISNYTIIGIYRSPSNVSIDSFINSLDQYLQSIHTHRNIIITGDININLIRKPSETAQIRANRLTYLNMTAIHGFLPGHCLPTREENCLDHVLLKLDKSQNSAFVAVLNTSVTDHAMVLLNISHTYQSKTCVKYKTITNFENAYKHLIDSDITFLSAHRDPNILADEMIKVIRTSLLQNTKVVSLSSSKRTLKPWISTGALRCIRFRNKLQLQKRKDPFNVILIITYKRFRTYCSNLIKKLKRQYHKKQILNSLKSPKLLWRKINDITHYKKPKVSSTHLLHITPHPLDSLNRVNQFFVTVGKTLAEEIITLTGQAPRPITNLNSLSQINSFVLLETDPAEVDSILGSLDSGSASGWDGIPVGFLKLARDLVVPLISQLTNLCFETGIFPDALKRSIITPVHKDGDKSDVNNYRPISVLPSFSKIIEKILNKRLISYLNKNKILSDSQYGFRQGRSTQDAVVALTSEIIDKIDKGYKCVTVFLDLKKAFDTVSVPILVQRLEAIGIRGKALSLFDSYLRGRRQQVKIGNSHSEEENIIFGVPQGSVIAPPLFLVYINDLCNLRNSGGKVFSYADDTAIVYFGNTWEAVCNNAEQGLNAIDRWLKANLLTLSVPKTNYICFSPSVRSKPGPNFRIRIHTCADHLDQNCNCRAIQRVTSTRYLGVIVDECLTWHSHIEVVTSRVRKFIWIFKNLRYVMPQKILNNIYIALTQSVITYCLPVWGGATKTKFLELERAQRSLIKVMYYKPYRYPTVDLYRISGLLSVRKLYFLIITLCLQKSIPFYSDSQEKRRKDLVAHSPMVRTAFARRQYATQSAYIYNKINAKVKFHPEVSHVCKKLITEWLKTLTYEETEQILVRLG